MPDIDGGHYFFTALLPIDNRGVVEHGDFKSSPVHMVRDALEALPTALQSPASEAIGIQSPFARSLRTHFLRLFVIDAPAYNGRDSQGALRSAVGVDLLRAQTVDRLACPWLVLVAEFDPNAGGAQEPRSWLEELWAVASAELTSAFEYCYQFEPKSDAAAFASFVIKGQVETTMPFNDYWTVPPPIPNLEPLYLAIAPAVGLVLGIALAVLLKLGVLPAIVLTLAFVALGAFVDVLLLGRLGARPFPTAPHSTLRDVLKALYLQQAFTAFAVAAQGASPAQLRAAFAAFVAATKPSDLDGPTQPPGVVRSRFAQENAAGTPDA